MYLSYATSIKIQLEIPSMSQIKDNSNCHLLFKMSLVIEQTKMQNILHLLLLIFPQHWFGGTFEHFSDYSGLEIVCVWSLNQE